jgi:hypothetical protein
MRNSRAFALIVLFAAAACDSSSNPGGTGGGGGGGSGGAGGSQAGTGGRGGMGGSSGTTGGASGAGGSGGSGGSGATDGREAASDVTNGGGFAGAFLDDCFNGLRPLAEFMSQISDRTSSNGAYRVRLAIEYPPGYIGTSGTIPWKAVRIGIVTPQKQVCIKDEAALANAYKGSHHNCADVLTVVTQGLAFEIKPPDVAPGRAVTTLAVTGEGAIPAVMLPTVTCKASRNDNCASGGPCQ